MRLVAVTCLLNEEDIVESFIRHHARLVDAHLVLDQGSNDGALEILRKLQAEGSAAQVFQNRAFICAETRFNAILYNLARRLTEADWVLFLNAEDFLDTRGVGELRGFLSIVPAEAYAISIPVFDYEAETEETAHESNPLRRLVRRAREPGARRVFVRGVLDSSRIALAPGCSELVLDGSVYAAPREDRLSIARFAFRSPYQYAGRSVIARLNTLAAGELDKAGDPSRHNDEVYDAMRAYPGEWFASALAYRHQLSSADHLVTDPLPYLGDEPRYTRTEQGEWRALRQVVGHVERFATALGTIMDRNEAIREKVHRDLLGLRQVL
jgi:hypothetical protein